MLRSLSCARIRPRLLLGFVLVLLILGTVLAPPREARACDICAIYTAVDLGPSKLGFRVGVGEQYTHFGTTLDDSEEVPSTGEKMDSSITQILLGYHFTPKIGLQLTIPIIHRTFTRLEEGELENGSETGFGDLALLGSFVPFEAVGENGLFRASLWGGLKLPSGNPDRLAEEQDEDHDTLDLNGDGIIDAEERIRQRLEGLSSTGLGSPLHDEAGSAIHGHDLALGSGSVDGIIGGHVFMSWDRFFLTQSAQYAIRTEGAFEYQYANDLTWQGGPGWFVYLDHDLSISLQGTVSGETKGNDTFEGEKLDDTAVTYVFAGPAMQVSWGTSFSFEMFGDIPFVRNETGLQIAPDYRIRGGLVWRF